MITLFLQLEKLRLASDCMNFSINPQDKYKIILETELENLMDFFRISNIVNCNILFRLIQQAAVPQISYFNPYAISNMQLHYADNGFVYPSQANIHQETT